MDKLIITLAVLACYSCSSQTLHNPERFVVENRDSITNSEGLKVVCDSSWFCFNFFPNDTIIDYCIDFESGTKLRCLNTFVSQATIEDIQWLLSFEGDTTIRCGIGNIYMGFNKEPVPVQLFTGLDVWDNIGSGLPLTTEFCALYIISAIYFQDAFFARSLWMINTETNEATKGVKWHYPTDYSGKKFTEERLDSFNTQISYVVDKSDEVIINELYKTYNDWYGLVLENGLNYMRRHKKNPLAKSKYQWSGVENSSKYEWPGLK